MKALLYYIFQIILAALFFYLGYLPTLKIDFFPWGNNNNDGLYLLAVPMILLPLIIVFSLLKYWIATKINATVFFQWTFIITIVASSLNTLIVSVANSNSGLFAVTLVSGIIVVFLLIETLLFLKKTALKNHVSI